MTHNAAVDEDKRQRTLWEQYFDFKAAWRELLVEFAKVTRLDRLVEWLAARLTR